MLTRYILKTATDDYYLSGDDLRNWDEIKVSYSRDGYGGIVRTFSSQFEFVNKARDLLLGIYLRDRLAADVTLEVQTINDNWNWTKVFSCPLDFSTVSFDNISFSINALDNSLASLIKANKGTTYEFTVGEDIIPDDTFIYDRLPMVESATYEFTQGTQYDNGDIFVTFENQGLPFMGCVGNETTIGTAVYWQDDQTNESNSFLLKANKDIVITLDYEVKWYADAGSDSGKLWLCTRTNGSYDYHNGIDLGMISKWNFAKVGEYSKSTDLPNADETWEKYNPSGDATHVTTTPYAIIGNTVWTVRYLGYNNGTGYYEWRNEGKSLRDFMTNRISGSKTVRLNPRDELLIVSVPTTSVPFKARIIQSKFVFSWVTRGDIAKIDVFTPITVLNALLRKIGQGKINASGAFSTHDSRLQSTYLLAAESARGIEGAKLYTSFDDFCGWMETVFGYVYHIGDAKASSYRKVKTAGGYSSSPYAQTVDPSLYYHGDIETERIMYYAQFGKFFYRIPNTAQLYSQWDGWTEYNDPTTGLARTDTLFWLPAYGEGLYMIQPSSLPAYPLEFNGNEDSMTMEFQTVEFLHRSQLFSKYRGLEVSYVTGLKYEIDTSQIFAAVRIGYEKKDYDNVNGRDEFNFNNTYSTECPLSDKTLTMISKYRADCYGIEFAVQKRGEETTDSSADTDVFFVQLSTQTYTDADGSVSAGLVPTRSPRPTGGLNGQLFNGSFSPMACVSANKEYIALQASRLTLKFASSEGNSAISIGGVRMSDDITIAPMMLTNGTLEFTCGVTDDIADPDEMVIVNSQGTQYRGFIKSVEIRYAKAEEVRYKILIKDITTT